MTTSSSDAAASNPNDYPRVLVRPNHVERVPRRIRAVLAGETILDTTFAHYVWELPFYPQYYLPLDSISAEYLVDDGVIEQTPRGRVRVCSLVVGTARRPGAARVLDESTITGLSATVHLDWAAVDAWYEEDERVFVHPRDPYTRVDALRSTRTVRVELDGVVLAESSSPVMVFETGLPTRYYVNRTEVNWQYLTPTDTETSCPYKGTTSGYWSAQVNGVTYDDLVWSYDFPTRDLLPIAGLVAFYNEKVDLVLDGRALPRPRTHFS
ncbi:MAG: hypothetical protein QOE71_3720 [Pseudonocardiales bacterium]|nr:hypothetical protein [Pseudonocardiales bacterium]